MKRFVVLALTVLVGLSVATGAMAKEGKKPTIKKENVATVTAEVLAIDLNARVVTLRGPEGNVFDLKVGEEAKNLPQLKVGDLVTAKFYESIVVEVRKPGEPGGVIGQRSGGDGRAGGEAGRGGGQSGHGNHHA